MGPEFDHTRVNFDPATGLVPAIVQDSVRGRVLMLGYMNAESLDRTLESGRVTFFSRSRNRLWEKGETSGNRLELVSLACDCDGDALLVAAIPSGPVCHTGSPGCFSSIGADDEDPDLGAALAELQAVVERRDRERPEGSYTTRLLTSGVLAIAKKVAEEGAETALAAVAEPERLAAESADLLYHLAVLWQAAGLRSEDVAAELFVRRR